MKEGGSFSCLFPVVEIEIEYVPSEKKGIEDIQVFAKTPINKESKLCTDKVRKGLEITWIE